MRHNNYRSIKIVEVTLKRIQFLEMLLEREKGIGGVGGRVEDT